MGMFDYLTCNYPLPVEGANKFEYQTKDFYCALDAYVIDYDGSLYMIDGKNVVFREDFSDSVYFYQYQPTKDINWIEFRAEFINGKLVKLKLFKLNDEFYDED